MTVDTKTYDFARIWLQAGGWTNELDVLKLSELVQDLCQDFEADLMREYEEACNDPARKGS